VGKGWQRWLVGSEYVISPFRAGRQPLSPDCALGGLERRGKVEDASRESKYEVVPN
jgi:hypothetical protein